LKDLEAVDFCKHQRAPHAVNCTPLGLSDICLRFAICSPTIQEGFRALQGSPSIFLKGKSARKKALAVARWKWSLLRTRETGQGSTTDKGCSLACRQWTSTLRSCWTRVGRSWRKPPIPVIAEAFGLSRNAIPSLSLFENLADSYW